MFIGPVEEQRFVDVEENALYWYFVVLAWLPIYAVIYWAPRLMLNAGDVRWLSPLPLWTGILAGPIAWALNLMATLRARPLDLRHRSADAAALISVVAFILVLAGVASHGWRCSTCLARSRPRAARHAPARVSWRCSGSRRLRSSRWRSLPMRTLQWVIDACQ